MNSRSVAPKELSILVCIVSFLVLIGLVFIYSSSSVYALEYAQDAAFFVKKQLLGLALGIVAALVCSRLPLRFWYWVAPWFFLCSVALTILTLVPGISYRIHGSSRWIKIASFSFQPSEILKWAVILYIAYLLARKEFLVKMPLRRYLPILLVLGFVSVLLLKQPDFGLMVTLAATIIALFFIAYPDWKYVFGLILAGVPLIALLIYFEPYRLRRILIFLNPWSDPQGAGFQIIQSQIAIGSGGVFGVGISHSRQKFFYLPMQHTDFIFSIIAEETGFCGAVVLIGLYLFFLYTGLRLSWRVGDSFARYIIQGFVLLVSIQAIINIAVAVGLFPTKGIGLPFVSYGNSSLVCSLAMLGVVARCAQE